MVLTRSSTSLVTRSGVNKSTKFFYLEDTTSSARKRIKKDKNSVIPLEECEYEDEDEDESDTLSVDSIIEKLENMSITSTTVEFDLNYDVDIDFDDAHDEWASNKKRGPNGTYVYICGKILKSGKKCQQTCIDKIGLYSGCKRHYMWEEKENKN